MRRRNAMFTAVSISVIALAGVWGALSGDFAHAATRSKQVQPVTPNVKNAAYTVENGIKVFHLTAEQVRQEVSKGVYANAWGYNGGTPGPTIVVNQGDKVRIVVTNHLPDSTSVHWHGLIVPNSMDGVPGAEPSPEIQPSKSFTYEFTVKQAGTFMYHSHVDVAKQEMMGLDGMFISLPKGGDVVNGQPVNRDYTLLLQEWDLVNPPQSKPGITATQGMGSNSMTSGMNGGYGEGQVPAGTYDVNPESMSWNIFTLNGKQFPATASMEVKKGDKVLVRLGNLSMQNHPMHLHGHNFTVVAKDGIPLPKSAQYEANTIDVAPGETYDVEFTADNPGTWVFHCHLPHHTSGPNGGDGGMLTTFHYQGTPWPSGLNTTSAKTGNMGGMNTGSADETTSRASSKGMHMSNSKSN